MAELVRVDPPLPLVEALDRALAYVDTQVGEDGVLRLAIQVWSESQRDPGLAEFVKATYTGFRGLFATLARRAQQTGELPGDADPDAVAAALFGLVPGYFMPRILTGQPDRRTYLTGVRTLLTQLRPAPR